MASPRASNREAKPSGRGTRPSVASPPKPASSQRTLHVPGGLDGKGSAVHSRNSSAGRLNAPGRYESDRASTPSPTTTTTKRRIEEVPPLQPPLEPKPPRKASLVAGPAGLTHVPPKKPLTSTAMRRGSSVAMDQSSSKARGPKPRLATGAGQKAPSTKAELPQPPPTASKEQHISASAALAADPASTSSSSFQDTIDDPQPSKSVSTSLPQCLGMPGPAETVPMSEYEPGPSLPPLITKAAHISSTRPVPRRISFDGTSNEMKLNRAIENLEDLVDEAVDVAEQAARQGQIHEVRDIIQGATDAVRRASAVPPRHLIAAGEPFRISDSSETSESSDSSSSSSYDDSRASRANIGQEKAPSNMPDQHGDSASTDWAYRENPDSHPIGPPSDGFQVDPSDPISPENTRSPQTTSVDRPRVGFAVPSSSPQRQRGRSQRRKERAEMRDQARQSRKDGFRSLDTRSPSIEPDYGPQFIRTSTMKPGDKTSSHKSRGRNRLHRQHHGHHHRRQPIARNWGNGRKRMAATIACINTAILGMIVGIYAGEVPSIQYMLADENHHVIIGNVALYAGLAVSTFISWPLPLLHGRKPYTLSSLALAMPLQFPQALVVAIRRSPKDPIYKTGLLLSRGCLGFVLGFANVNFLATLLDLFGASLQSKNPHQEFVVASDVRRNGGGMGLWLGLWSWCSLGSLAVGFQIGAGIIQSHTPDWGFYVVIILLAVAMLLNVMAPETRRATHRTSITEMHTEDANYTERRVVRGEVKLHLETRGPEYWFEEVWAGIKLSSMMMCQAGFGVVAFYLAWMYAQIVLVIVLLGALLSRDYRWHPQFVGLGVLSIAIGALFALPLTKANVFSRSRKRPFRTDSMSFQKQVSWSSHLVRRVIFTLTLPLMGVAYTVSSAGKPKPYIVPIVFAGAVGFLSILAMAECVGLIMETFDTSDLQPGVNTRHRLQSMATQDRLRRTPYSSFPRVTAGLFASQTLAFIGAAVATEVGGIMTRHIGAQASTGVAAGILFGQTILLAAVLFRWKNVQVIPDNALGDRRDSKAWEEWGRTGGDRPDWMPVIIGNPSGKIRRMSVLELGALSRWSEIRKLNFLGPPESDDESSDKERRRRRRRMEV